jgi:hypothetical protein
MHALRHETIDGPHSVAQTEQKHYRGIPVKVPQGEWFPFGKLRHNISEREREVTQVLLGRWGPRKASS